MYKIDMSNLKLLGLLILIFAIPVTLYLAGHPQIFRGRATGTSEITFLDQNNNPITQSSSQNVNLRLTYSGQTVQSQGSSAGNNLCGISLTDGQTISGNVPVVVTGQRPDPVSYLSLQIINSREGSFQTISTQSNVLFANISTATLFQNGQATIECRIQTEPTGGTIISSRSVNFNVQN